MKKKIDKIFPKIYRTWSNLRNFYRLIKSGIAGRNLSGLCEHVVKTHRHCKIWKPRNFPNFSNFGKIVPKNFIFLPKRKIPGREGDLNDLGNLAYTTAVGMQDLTKESGEVRWKPWERKPKSFSKTILNLSSLWKIFPNSRNFWKILTNLRNETIFFSIFDKFWNFVNILNKM